MDAFCAGCQLPLSQSRLVTQPTASSEGSAEAAAAAQRREADSGVRSCPLCAAVVCGVCDVFIHTELHVCPGCKG